MTEMQLSVAYVEFGGNTGGGEYFYAFSPQSVIARNPNAPFRISFTKSTDARFRIVEILTTDTQNEFRNPILTPDQRSVEFTNSNTKKQLISVSTLVFDSVNQTYINCDPQVLNSPEI